MKKILLLSVAFCAVSFTANAADIMPYASAKALYSFSKGKIDDESTTFKNPGVDIAAGVRFAF